MRELGFYGSKRTDFAYVASRNPNVNMSYITTHPELKWEWDLISRRSTLRTIITHPHLPWNYEVSFDGIASGDLEFLLEHLDWLDTVNIDRKKLLITLYSKHRYITTAQVKAIHPKPWDWYTAYLFEDLDSVQGVTHRNINLTFEYVLAHLEKYKYWGDISYLLPLNVRDVIDHPTLDWSFRALSSNKFGYDDRVFESKMLKYHMEQPLPHCLGSC